MRVGAHIIWGGRTNFLHMGLGLTCYAAVYTHKYIYTLNIFSFLLCSGEVRYKVSFSFRFNIRRTFAFAWHCSTADSSTKDITTRRADGTGDGGDMTPPRFIVTRSVPLTVSRKATSVNRGSIRVSSSCGPDRRSFKRARSDFWKTLLTTVPDRVPKHTCSQPAVRGRVLYW